MTREMNDMVTAVVDRIVDAAHPLRIVLFGSQARADATPSSDVDLLVIEAEPFGEGRSRFKEIARLRGSKDHIVNTAPAREVSCMPELETARRFG